MTARQPPFIRFTATPDEAAAFALGTLLLCLVVVATGWLLVATRIDWTHVAYGVAVAVALNAVYRWWSA